MATEEKETKLEIKWVISRHTTTDGKCYIYLSPKDGGTADIEAIVCEGEFYE